jgi:serine/threonine protein kinase
MQDAPTTRVVCFGPWRLDLKAGELRQNGQTIRLQEQPLRILEMLVTHPGEVISREEIRKKLWPNDTVVEFDHSINAAIKKLRFALGDSAEAPRFIETVARRGYRWKMAVNSVEQPPDIAGVPHVSQPSPRSRDRSLSGKKVSHYRVLDILGGGGMGVVYRAEDLKLGRRVALKFLPEELAGDPATLTRFEQEARATSALNHPNICTIYEVEEHEGQPFIVMELLEGQTLRELIAAETSPQPTDGQKGAVPEQLLQYAIQIAEGLKAAHNKGIVHRDIKPANIFITTYGQVKILDFGLAKLLDAEARISCKETLSPTSPNQEKNPTLTHTGTTIGTAGYMSPEQLRGEKLDPRTDLFSFGLVMYEMATREQAFKGDTAPALRAAILENTPTPVRQLKPELPQKLEEIVHRALEKDREMRYQSAAELCADLQSEAEAIRNGKASKTGSLSWVAAGLILVLLLLASVIYWLAKRQETIPSQPKLLQLTSNSAENWVLDSAISPDGKYLAYADRKSIQIKKLETGEIESIVPPSTPPGNSLPAGSVIFAWFPDSRRLAVTTRAVIESEPDTYVGGPCTGIWILSKTGEPPRKLRDDGCVQAVSPDGAWIAFTIIGRRLDHFGNQIWLMGPNGEQPHRLYETDEHSRYEVVKWSPGGHRLVYYRSHESGDASQGIVQSRDLRGGPPTTMLLPTEYIGDFSWLPGGRLLYSLREPGRTDSNFWETLVDERTGQPRATAKRLTDWTGLGMDSFSATANGKQLVFHRYSGQGSVYVADLVPGWQITTPRHLTLTEDWNVATAWTADSKAVIFTSNRNGSTGIFKQAIDSDTGEPIVTKNVGWGSPQVSPKGDWILYSSAKSSGEQAAVDLLRVPTSGGPSQLVFTTLPGATFRCAKAPAERCVIAERSLDNKLLALTAFDPIAGRGQEIFRLDFLGADYSWDLSPDGTRVAFVRGQEDPIQIIEVKRGSTQQISPTRWTTTESLHWTADGKGLLISGRVRGEMSLLHIDLQGRGHVLWGAREAGSEHIQIGAPSPDGRHLAISRENFSGNIWMMENF